MVYEINLWDLQNEKIKIRFKKEIRENFFSQVQKIFNNHKEISHYLGISLRRFYRLKSGKSSIPLIFVIKIFIKFLPKIKIMYQKKIESNLEEIKFGNNPKAKSIKNPRFPIKFSLQLARVAAHIVGDGGIRRTDTDVTVYYANKNSSLIYQFKNDVHDIFGEIDIKEYEYKGTTIVILPSIVGFVLTKFFGEQQNDMKHIPEIIFNSKKEIQAIFLRSLYDDEGSVLVKSNCILLKMTSKNIIEDCHKILKKFSIIAGNIKFKDFYNKKKTYHFYISGKPDVEKFGKYINFEHDSKIKQLNNLLSNYKKEGFKQGDTRERIFEHIQNNDGITVKKLSRKLRIPSSAIRVHTRKMKHENRITTIKNKHEELFFENL